MPRAARRAPFSSIDVYGAVLANWSAFSGSCAGACRCSGGPPKPDETPTVRQHLRPDSGFAARTGEETVNSRQRLPSRPNAIVHDTLLQHRDFTSPWSPRLPHRGSPLSSLSVTALGEAEALRASHTPSAPIPPDIALHHPKEREKDSAPTPQRSEPTRLNYTHLAHHETSRI